MFKIGLREKVNDPSVRTLPGLAVPAATGHLTSGACRRRWATGRSFRRAADPTGAKPRDGAGGQGETLSRLGVNAPRRSD